MATAKSATKSAESGGNFDNEELLALAKLDLSKNEIEKALSKIKQVLNDSKPPAETFSIAAKIYAQLKLYTRAQEMFNAYIKANPDAQLETFQLGMTYFESGDRKEAVKVWGQILEKLPKHPPALFYSALAFAQDNDVIAAKKILSTLIQSAPNDNLYFNRGKDLLTSIERGEKAKVPDGNDAGAASSFLLNTTYGTEH